MHPHHPDHRTICDDCDQNPDECDCDPDTCYTDMLAAEADARDDALRDPKEEK